MNQFSLPTMTRVNVTNVNVRSELHGDDHVPAVDLSIKLTTSNLVLSEFDGVLRGMLYEKAGKPSKEQQASLDGVEQVSDLPALRCHCIEQPIRLTNEYAGYNLRVDRGLGGASNIVLGGCSVDKFRADCKEGGTVELSFRVQASKLDADVLGKLAMLIGNEVSITLMPPEVAQQDIDDEKPAPKAKAGRKDSDPSGRTDAWPFPKNKSQQEASDAFAAAHGVTAT